jgi:tetratricopeptide (TPR) repeat protein
MSALHDLKHRRAQCVHTARPCNKVTRLDIFGIKRRLSRKRLKQLRNKADRARDAMDWLDASRLYQQVLEIDPLNAAIHIQLGHACKEHGDLTNAERSYRAALQLKPADDDIHLQIGHLEKLKGRLDKAVLAYRKAAELNPLNAEAVKEYNALAPRFDLPSAQLTLSGVLSRRTDSITLNGPSPAAVLQMPDVPNHNVSLQELRACGDQARDNRCWDKAAQAYQAYLATAPKDSAIWLQLGNALRESGDLAAAEAAYRTALTHAPDNAGIYMWLGHALRESGDLAAAEAAYRTALTYAPDNADLHLQLGHLIKLRGDMPSAHQYYDAAHRLDPLSPSAHEALQSLANELVQRGNLLKDNGKYREAEDAYISALQLNPLDADCHLQLGHLMKLCDDVPSAREYAGLDSFPERKLDVDTQTALVLNRLVGATQWRRD